MISFPADCTTPAERTEYAYHAQEVLRLEHNRIGKQFREGEISKAEWNTFLIEIFEPTSNKIVNAILEQRQLLKESTRWDISVEDLI